MRTAAAVLLSALLVLPPRAAALAADDHARFVAALDLARQAYKASDSRKAKRYANRLIQQAGRFHKDPIYGDAVYWGHEINGLLALEKNDVKKAERELEDAAKTPGSPALAADGPDMTLALRLIELGRPAAALKLFDRCAVIWPAGAARVEAWRAALMNGQKPDFSGRLQLSPDAMKGTSP